MSVGDREGEKGNLTHSGALVTAAIATIPIRKAWQHTRVVAVTVAVAVT